MPQTEIFSTKKSLRGIKEKGGRQCNVVAGILCGSGDKKDMEPRMISI
jgi:hypothetical protein